MRSASLLLFAMLAGWLTLGGCAPSGADGREERARRTALMVGSETELSSGRGDGLVGDALPSSSLALTADGRALVTWEELRSETGYEQFFTRLDSAGTPQDLEGFRPPARHRTGSVASDGTSWLVIYSGTTGSPRVHRVASDATFSSDALLPGRGGSARLAWGGSSYLTVWADCAGGSACLSTLPDDAVDVVAARVDAQGRVIDDAGIRLTGAPGRQTQPQLAYGAGQYLVAWADAQDGGYDVRGARVEAATGQVLDVATLPLAVAAGDQTQPEVGFDGTNFLVSWLDAPVSGQSRSVGTRVSPMGTVLDSPALQLSPTAQTLERHRLACRSGGDCLETWKGSSGVSGRWVFKGGLLNSTPTPLWPLGTWRGGAEPLDVAVAATGEGFVVVSTFGGHGPAEARLSGPTWDGGSTDLQQPITFALGPVAISTSWGSLVVWSEGTHTTNGDALMQRFDGYGRALGLPVPLAASAANEFDVTCATDGTNVLCAWNEESALGANDYDVTGTLIGPQGQRLKDFKLPRPGYSDGISLAWTGSVYLVTWLEDSTPDGWAARISAAGLPLDPVGVLLPLGAPLASLRLAPASGGALLLWKRAASAGDQFGVSKLESTGALSSTRTLGAEPGFQARGSACAPDSSVCAFSWRSDRFGGPIAWLFDGQGNTLASDVVLGTGAYGNALAWDTDRFRVIATEPDGGPNQLVTFDLFGDGGVDRAGAVWLTNTDEHLEVSVAMRASGVALVADQRYSSARQRSFVRLVAFGDAGLPVSPDDGGAGGGGGGGEAGGGGEPSRAPLAVGCGCSSGAAAATTWPWALSLALVATCRRRGTSYRRVNRSITNR